MEEIFLIGFQVALKYLFQEFKLQLFWLESKEVIFSIKFQVL